MIEQAARGRLAGLHQPLAGKYRIEEGSPQALSEMGRHIAAESMDEISHRYYSEFSSSLHPLVSKRESRLETNAKDIRWSRSLVRG